MADVQTNTIEAALLALSGVCDGAVSDDGHGFNGRDAEIGNSMATQVRAGRRLTPKQREVAYKILRTYRVQLGKLGVDYGAIPAPFQSPSDDLSAGVAGSPPEGTPHLVARHGEWTSDVGDPLAPRGDGALHSQAGEPLPVAAFVGTLAPGAGRLPGAHPAAAQPVGLTARDILGPGGRISRQLPGYEPRAPQLELADRIEYAIDEERHFVGEAGTGVGKSLAYLVPAVLSDKATIVSTADKSLQAQLWQKDIPFLKSVMPKPFKAALLKGRGNYLCLRQLSETQQGQQQSSFDGMEVGFRSPEAARDWPDVVDWAKTTDTGDLEDLPFALHAELKAAVSVDSDGCVGDKCPFRESCWSERAKAAAKAADVVVVNHALLLRDLELRYRTEGHATLLPDAYTIVIDEAHHLEEIATDAFGLELSGGRYTRLVTRLEKLTTEHPKVKAADEASEERVLAQRWAQAAQQIGDALSAFLERIQARMVASKVTTQRLGSEDAGAIIAAIVVLSDQLAQETPYWLETDQREAWRKLAAAFSDCGLALTVMTTTEPDSDGGLVTRGPKYVRFAELAGQGQYQRVVLHAKPIDVSDELRARLFSKFPTVVSVSATIATDSGFSYWRERVGCDEADELLVPSPFDYRRNALLYLPQDGAAFDPSQSRGDDSIQYLDRLAAQIEHLLLASDGRAFCLFTSFRTLNEVYARLSPRLSRWLVLKQGELPRPELVRRFKADGSAILFGVKSFWEGVDVSGDALSLVIIDKLPFAPPDDPVWEAKCEAINRKYQDRWAWFNHLAIPNAVIALKQGFGRLIRTGSDRGVVAILDGRLVTKNYGTRIVRALPPATQTRSLEAVAAFFGSAT